MNLTFKIYDIISFRKISAVLTHSQPLSEMKFPKFIVQFLERSSLLMSMLVISSPIYAPKKLTVKIHLNF